MTSTAHGPDTPQHRRGRRLLASGVLGALIGAALIPTTMIPAAGGSQRADVSLAPVGSMTDWAACPDSQVAQCGTLHVPLDWSKPHGEQISLSAVRRPADQPSRRIGTLFFNPGGPGDTPNGYIIGAENIFSAELRARFDLVGLDPRAVGASTQVRCDVPALTPTTTLFPRTEQQFEELRSHNREVGLSCLRQTGPFLGHTDTISVARDHEALRSALGVKQVTWLGLSYGTQVAANYAQLYPRRTRAMVLDAALEHSMPEVQQVADEAMAAEDSFNRFAAWCPTTPTCALQDQDVATIFDSLVDRADRSPIPVPGAMRGVTGEDIRMGTKGLLRFKEPSIYGPDLSWAGLSRALKSTLEGDASAFALPPVDVPQDGLFAQLAIGCMEYVPQIHTYGQMQQRIQMGRQIAPHLQGASETWQVNFCIGWPIPAANPPRLLDVRGVPTLMVHAAHDPSDPYKWAHSLAAQIRGSVMLTRSGDGHTSYHTSPCARAAIDDYLVRVTAPADRVCAD
jgi:pimeloyl-ACP methyl ester carboxylesterase